MARKTIQCGAWELNAIQVSILISGRAGYREAIHDRNLGDPEEYRMPNACSAYCLTTHRASLALVNKGGQFEDEHALYSAWLNEYTKDCSE